MGGYLAQFLAARDPARIRKVVLGNTFPPNDAIRRRALLGARYLPWVPEWAIMAGMRRNALRVLFPASGNSELVKAYLYEQTCGFMRKSDVIARCACLCETFTPPDLSKTGIPALVIEADNDPLVGAELREMLKTAYPWGRPSSASPDGCKHVRPNPACRDETAYGVEVNRGTRAPCRSR